MAEALRLDIVIDPSGQARDVLVDLWAKFVKAGDTAEEASRKVEKFEKALADNSAKKEAKRALDDIAKANAEVGNKAEGAEPKVKKLDSATSALVGTIARYAAPAVIGAAILRTADWASGLTDLSKSTNISIGNLQKFENIGRNYGQTVQQIANNVLMMSDRIAGGDKSAAAALDRLGLSANRFVNLNPDQAFLELAAAVAKVENPMERVALAKDVLGRSAANLLPMLLDLNEEWGKQSHVLSDDTIIALDKLDDAWEQVKGSGAKLLAEVVAPLAPAFVALADAISSAAASAIPTARNWFDGMIEKLMEMRLRIAEARQAWDEWRMLPDWTYLDVKGAAGRQPAGVPVGSAQWLRDELEAFRRNRNTPTSRAPSADWQGPPFDPGDADRMKRERERLEREREQFIFNWNNSQAKFQEELERDAEQTRLFYEKTNREYLLSVTKWSQATNEQLTKPMADAILANAKLHAKYQSDLTKLVEKSTLSRVDFQIAQIKRWADNEKAQLNRAAGDWKENVDLINKIAHELEVEALQELWQGPPAPEGGDSGRRGILNADWEGIYDGAMRVVGAFQHMAGVLSQVRTNGQAAMGALTGFDTGMGLAGSLGLSGGAAGALGIFGAVAALAVGLNNARQAARNYRDALSRASLDMQRTMFDIGPELTSRLSPERHEEFQRLSDITYPSESQLERMADIIGEMRLRIVETNDAFADLAARMERAGMRMPQHFRDAADHLRNLGVLTKENAKLLDGLMNRAPDWRLMQQTAEKFGIDIDSLGKSFQGGRIGARAQELIDAWELLTKGAPEAQGGVLFGMKDELQSLLNDALRHGLTLPENLRPLFEELLRTNQLTDPFTGEALQGMHEIRFGPAVLTEFEKISQDMEAFLRTLGIDVTSSIDRGSQAIVDAVNNIRIDVDWSTNPGGQLPRERFDDGEGRAMGTFGATGRFDPEDFGAGTWMRLHGRETIVREDQREAFADDVIRERGEDRNTTRPGGDVYLIPISAERDDDRELARVIRDIANNRGGSKIRLRDALYRRGEDRRVRL